jgi:hypothetical protein
VTIFSINSKNAASELFKLSAEVFANNAAEALRVASNALAAKANEQLSQKAVDFTDSRLARPQAEIDKLKIQKEAFIDQATLLSKAAHQMGWIDIRLGEIKSALLTLNAASTPGERQAAAALLDEKLLVINGLARDAGGFGKNPIGKPFSSDFRTADVIASYVPFGEPLIIKGQFAGSEFSITDGEGQSWRYDRSTGTLAEFNSWPDSPTGVSYPASAVSVGAFDSGTGAITLNTPGGPIGGTLTRYGQGVLDSFLYNGLASDADVTRALDDVNAAIASFGAKKAVIAGAAATLNGRLGQLNLRIKGLDDRIQDEISIMTDEKAARDKALRTRVQLQQQAMSLSLGSAGAMVDMFFRDSIKTGSILDRF